MNFEYSVFKTFLCWILIVKNKAFWRSHYYSYNTNTRSLYTFSRTIHNCRTEPSIQDFCHSVSENKFNPIRTHHQSLNNIRRSVNDNDRFNVTTHKLTIPSYPIMKRKLDKASQPKFINRRHLTATVNPIEQKIENFLNKFKAASSRSSRLTVHEKKSLLTELLDWLPLFCAADVLKLMSYLVHFNFPPRSKVQSVKVFLKHIIFHLFVTLFPGFIGN